jgi:2-polyprenyl-3-methyl-5-hydroxy-6-metoxy-1,4-benzoquinol methylase
MKRCKVCNSQAEFLAEISSHRLPTFLCKQCGLLFIGNPPGMAEVKEDYSRWDVRGYYANVATNFDEKIKTAIDDLRPSINGTRPKLLDVGCGDGKFLEDLSRSITCEVVGCEFAPLGAKLTRERGIRTYECLLDSIPETFTHITALDVIEHIADPKEFLLQCRNILEPDGYLYLHTPRRCFWDSVFIWLAKTPLRFIAEKWLRTRVNRAHVQLWNENALSKCLQGAGFRILSVRAEQELVWPIRQYVFAYLSGPKWVKSMLSAMFAIVLKPTLKNKAIILARRSDSDWSPAAG